MLFHVICHDVPELSVSIARCHVHKTALTSCSSTKSVADPAIA